MAIRLFVIVEGLTERLFVEQVLATALWSRKINARAIILGVPGHKGGRTNYDRVRKDVLTVLKQHRDSYCSTMLDFYGLGKGFPGGDFPASFSSADKVKRLEEAMLDDVAAQIPNLRPRERFIPYLQLHEFEGLLFSDPAALAAGIGRLDLGEAFLAIRQEVSSPELINDEPDKAPSKRLLSLWPKYRKTNHGALAAEAVGLSKMREECPHFANWLARIESLVEL